MRYDCLCHGTSFYKSLYINGSSREILNDESRGHMESPLAFIIGQSKREDR